MFYTQTGSSAYQERGLVAVAQVRILGIDPGLAHTGWGVVVADGPRLACVAYGCTQTAASDDLSARLLKIHDQIEAVIERFSPTMAAIETVWFGQNISAAFGTGQARGAALVACARSGVSVGEYTPRQIKLAVVGTGTAEKDQVGYMVTKLLGLDAVPHPDHASDALAAALCHCTHGLSAYARRVASSSAERSARGAREQTASVQAARS